MNERVEGFEGILELYGRHKGIQKLYDWQKECLSLSCIKSHRNLLISLPTSGGKTLIAEFLIMKEIMDHKKNALFILPFVSIVQEKVISLTPFGLEKNFFIEEYAGSRGVFPPRKHTKKKCVYVSTIEKSVLIISSLVESDRISEIGLVVVDEFHLIGDRNRGHVLEGLIIKLLSIGGIQIVGMSATMGNLRQLAVFMNAQLFTNEFRPVELTEYVKVEKEIFVVTRDRDKPLQYSSRFPLTKNPNLREVSGLSNDDMYDIGHLVMEMFPNNACLIFCPTKANCRNIVKILTSTLPLEMLKYKYDNKVRLINALKQAGTNICPILLTGLKFGVAYHHSGLTFDERKFIEDAFKYKTIFCICCTSTLAAGVNLPAERVIIRRPLVGSEFISLSMYKQMVGRAGRSGFGKTGDSYLICNLSETKQVGALLSSQMDICHSHLHGEGLSNLILSIIHLKLANNINTLRSVMVKSLFALQNPEFLHSSKLEGIVKDLEMSQLLVIHDENLCLTKYGRALLKGNMNNIRGKELYEDLNRAKNRLIINDNLHLLYLASAYHLWPEFRIEFQSFTDLFSSLKETEYLVAEAVGLSRNCINKMAAGFKPSTDVERIIHKYMIALLINAVLNGLSVEQVQDKFSIPRGDVNQLLYLSATYTSGVVRFCEELPEFSIFVKIMKDLPKSLSYCCSPELYNLMELPSVQLGRARQLYSKGLKDIKDIANKDPRELTRIIDHLNPKQAREIVTAAKFMLKSQAEILEEEMQEILNGLK